MIVKYSSCEVCGKDFEISDALVALVISATPGGDTTLRFVHAICVLLPQRRRR